MNEFAPEAIQHLFDDVQDGISAAVMGGILGDQAHTYGYHRCRAVLPKSDYSVQLAADKRGDPQAASALDISWNTSGPQYQVSRRLLDAKYDPRCTNVLREFYGSLDGREVCGWDYQESHSATSDDSHL